MISPKADIHGRGGDLRFRLPVSCNLTVCVAASSAEMTILPIMMIRMASRHAAPAMIRPNPSTAAFIPATICLGESAWSPTGSTTLIQPHLVRVDHQLEPCAIGLPARLCFRAADLGVAALGDLQFGQAHCIELEAAPHALDR